MKKIIKSLRIYGVLKTIAILMRAISFFFCKTVLNKKYLTRDINGSSMVLDLRNEGISKTLWTFGTREELDIEIMKRELRNEMTILEAGANIGYYLLLESRLTNKNCKIFAFEPDPRNLDILKLNIKRNNLEKITHVFPHGVSNINGKGKFFISNESNLNTMVENEKSAKFIDIDLIAIDDFKEINTPLNFIRMDIEGYEFEAINGMLKKLEESTEVKIMMELHPQFYNEKRNFSKLISHLFSIGFHAKYIVSAGYHSPKEILQRGYLPEKISEEITLSHGLYKNIKNNDFIDFLNNPEKIVRSVLLVKE